MDKVAIVDPDDLEKEALAAAADARSLAALAEVRVRYVGRQSALKLALRQVRDRESGMTLNAVRETVESALSAKEAELARAELEERLATERVDVTLPAKLLQTEEQKLKLRPRGTLHPSTLVRRDVEDIFLGLGYEIVDGREVETTRYNFDALGFPEWHPARSPRASLFLDDQTLLRTETSPAQIHKMEERRPPIYMVSIGRVYRRDTIDATHFPIFHQFEGLAIDKGITLADLKGTLLYVMRQLYGPDREVRFRTHYFPFTEPSMEPDVSCFNCGGAGCAVCKHSGWIEMGGSGMVDPYLYEFVGWGPEEYSGFAFGMGIERTAQLRYGISGIRPFWDNDLRFLRQFPMRIPLGWLREYVRVDAGGQEIADALSITTAEVNGVHRVGVLGDLGLFRVGHVLEAEKHPDADRLQLTSVDVGEDRPYSIVCGAWNFGAGAKVAVALPGATLPNGLVLERRKLRGQVSEGMILAEDELDLGTDHSGIIVLGDALEAGTPLAEVLPLVEEVLDLEPTGNRADLFAVYGVAREVAALFGGELMPMPGEEPPQGGDEAVGIGIDDPEGCLRFIGRVFRDVTVGDSPPWLRARLRHAGVRSISNVVDVTNYVMLALGSPLHAYDLDLLRGGLVARRARDGEKVRTLDGVERTLSAEDLVIADGERAVGLAGIMGGEETEVSSTTTNVLLEAANFEPVGILRSSERHALRTEGSNRWEKGVDPHVAGPAATYATQLIVELAGARWAGAEDVQGDLPEPAVIQLRPERASGLMGLDVSAEQQEEILAPIGFHQLETGYRVPTWRARDVTREVDVIEEVARFKLPEIPFTLPRRDAMFGRLTREQLLRRQVEDVLVGVGYAEVYTPSFVAEGDLRLPEPLSAEAAALRGVLYASLLEPARRNAAAGEEAVALFEVARVYRTSGGELPDERWHVAGLADGGFAEVKWAVEQIYSALGIEPSYERTSESYLHPGKAARTAEGWLGELHPALLDGDWGAFELDLDALAEAAPHVAAFAEVSPYPEVRQDLAFTVDEDVPASEILAAIREAAGELLRELEAFDEYRGEQIGEGKRSLAFRLAFGSLEGTLTDEDVAPVRASIVDALATRFGAVLRT